MYICIYLLVYIGLLILLKNNKVLAVWVHLRGHDALVNFFAVSNTFGVCLSS